jgi:hypothetical protein
MKMTKSNIVGMHVVLNDKPNAQVYKIIDKDESMRMYAIAYVTTNGMTPKYWIDISALTPATPEQISQYTSDEYRIYAGENFAA